MALSERNYNGDEMIYEKPKPIKPKPDIKEERHKKVLKSLERKQKELVEAERKLKRIKTAIKKLERKKRYYED